MRKIDFCKRYGYEALLVEGATGLLADIILAQSALETGWGDAAYENNLFGIKAREDEPYFIKQTREWSNDRFERTQAKFRKFESALECMLRYCERIRKEYELSWSYRYNPQLYFQHLRFGRWGSYATDPSYYELCVSVYHSLPAWRDTND